MSMEGRGRQENGGRPNVFTQVIWHEQNHIRVKGVDEDLVRSHGAVEAKRGVVR